MQDGAADLSRLILVLLSIASTIFAQVLLAVFSVFVMSHGK
jgi:hypothetical protein